MTASANIGGVGPDAHQFTNITSATTTVVKASRGTLVRIVNNKKVANGVITIYDHASAASGTKVGTITNPATLLNNSETYEYGVAMANGIVVVTGAADDLTIVWD